MSPLKLTSVDLEPLSALSEKIKLIFHAYSDETGRWREYELLLNTGSNCAIPTEITTEGYYPYEPFYSEQGKKFNLQTLDPSKFQVEGNRNGQEWYSYYEDGGNETCSEFEDIDEGEVHELLLGVFDRRGLVRIVSEVYHHQFG